MLEEKINTYKNVAILALCSRTQFNCFSHCQRFFLQQYIYFSLPSYSPEERSGLQSTSDINEHNSNPEIFLRQDSEMFIDGITLWYFFLPSESFLSLPQKQQDKSSVHTGNLHQKLSEVLPLGIPISIKIISGRLEREEK